VTTSWTSASVIMGWPGDSTHTFIINKEISYFYYHFHINTHTWDLHTHLHISDIKGTRKQGKIRRVLAMRH
jgi:hypothetical protein